MIRKLALLVVLLSVSAFAQSGARPVPLLCPNCNLTEQSLTLGTAPAASAGQLSAVNVSTSATTGNQAINIVAGSKLCLNGATCTDALNDDGAGNAQYTTAVFKTNAKTQLGAGFNGILCDPTSNTGSICTVGASRFWTIDTTTAGFALNLGTTNATIVNIGNKSTVTSLFGTVNQYAPRTTGSYATVTNADTAFTAVNLPAPTLLSGTTGTADTASDTAYNMIKYTTSSVSGNPVALSGPFTTTGPTRLGIDYWVVHTDASSVATTRLYVGFGASSLDQVTTLAGANTVKGCWFRFDTGIGDTNWMAESSDGTTASANDTTIAVAANTTYILAIDNTVSGTCGFYVNGVLKVAKVANITTTQQAMGFESSITTLTTTAHALSIAKLVTQQN